jgi:hypothetical protein
VHPGRRSRPRVSGHGLVPGRGDRRHVDPGAEGGDRPPGQLITLLQRYATGDSRLDRPVERLDCDHRADETGEIQGDIDQIHLGIRVGSGQPWYDRPRPWVACARLSDRKRDRYRNGQVRCEQRQPMRVGLHLVHRPRCPRQPRYQLVAEAKQRIIGAVQGLRDDRQPRPLRELLGDQAAHLVDAYGDLSCASHRPTVRRLMVASV